MTQLSINTTQNVNINFTAASIGDRILAYLLDFLAKTAYVIVIYSVFFYGLGINKLMDKMDDWSRISILVLFYMPVAFYSLLLESMLEGQTLGKRLLKIKVVKIDGYQASFGDYLMRWLFRIIDVSFSSGIVGLVSIIASEKSQRLGDMAGGTSVITLKNNININHTILEEIDVSYVPTYPLVIKLSDNDARIIKETFNSARANKDYHMITRLKTKIEDVTGIRNQSGNDEDFIKTILKDYNYYTQKM
ncbi:RDD family protein [Flavobacterium lindanitolerans]|uniref:RDD family protein n=1 Tax=Flavobacterium lindanitolerans TaxID=428988 RepID=UPI0028077051|nr:RDD family protein [Flavobacterium lindanitolerans]MDQ7962208.1 RDD family protein [Flavobacterium lindanitolerans]